MHLKCRANGLIQRKKTGETKTVRAIKYHHLPGWVSVLSHKVNFLELLLQRAKGCLFDQQGHSFELGLSIQGSVLTNHTCRVVKKPQNHEKCYNDIVPRDCKTGGVSVLNTIRGVDQFEFFWSQGSWWRWWWWWMSSITFCSSESYCYKALSPLLTHFL